MFSPLRFLSRRSLRALLTLAFAGVSILMGAVMTISLGRLATDTMRRDIGSSLLELAGHMRTRLDLGMYERLREVETIASLRQIRDTESDAKDNRYVLDKLRRSYAEIAWIGFAGDDGHVLVAGDGVLEGADVSSRPWYQGGRTGSFSGDVHEAKLLAKLLPPPPNGEPLRFVDVATPVFGLDGHFRGVLGAHLSWQWARDIEQTVFSPDRRGTGVEAFILNREGKVLLAPPGHEGVVAPIMAVATSQDRADVLVWPDGRAYLTASVPTRGYGDFQGLGWTVVARQAINDAYLPVRQLQWTVLALGVGFAVMFALFGFWLASRLAAPLVGLTHAADRLRNGEDRVVIPLRGYREAHRLAASFKHLVEALATEHKKLATLNESLESQVRDRTAMLDATNRHLLSVLEEREKLVSRLESLANTDSMTQLLNRRAFFERAEVELRRAERQDSALSAIILDIDHFKRINDGHGHHMGDEAIRHLADCLRRELREVDVVARFGGEEFVALLPDADEAQAVGVAERLRQAIADIRLASPSGPIPITASFGVAQWMRDMTVEALVSQADTALYEAKHGGRNQVRVWMASAK